MGSGYGGCYSTHASGQLSSSMNCHPQLQPDRNSRISRRIYNRISQRTGHEKKVFLGMVQKGVGYRCRNGPQGASHNGTRPLFEPCSLFRDDSTCDDGPRCKNRSGSGDKSPHSETREALKKLNSNGRRSYSLSTTAMDPSRFAPSLPLPE